MYYTYVLYSEKYEKLYLGQGLYYMKTLYYNMDYLGQRWKNLLNQD